MGWEGRGRWREGAALKKGMERRVAKPLDCRHQCASEMNCRTRRRLSRPSRLSESSIRVTASADRSPAAFPSRLSESPPQPTASLSLPDRGSPIRVVYPSPFRVVYPNIYLSRRSEYSIRVAYPSCGYLGRLAGADVDDAGGGDGEVLRPDLVALRRSC